MYRERTNLTKMGKTIGILGEMGAYATVIYILILFVKPLLRSIRSSPNHIFIIQKLLQESLLTIKMVDPTLLLAKMAIKKHTNKWPYVFRTG